jgi:hypothetical protein
MNGQLLNSIARKIGGAALLVCALAGTLWLPSTASAATQEDVLKSISENVGGKSDPMPLFWGVAAIVTVSVLLSIFNRRMQRVASPKALNNPGKLLKQLVADIHLRPAELKQLKTLADMEHLEYSLTLLLCPSLLSKTIKENPQRVDPKTIVELAKRFE